MKTKSVTRILALILALAMLAGCNFIPPGNMEPESSVPAKPELPEPSETPGLGDPPPDVTITLGGQTIHYTVGLNYWNGAMVDRLDVLEALMREDSGIEVPYLPLGGTIEIRFADDPPASIDLYDYLVDETGRRKYERPAQNDISNLTSNTGELSYDFEPHPFSMLSSSTADYEDGNTYRGFILRCKWENENTCEYGFVIRTDAAEKTPAEKPWEEMSDYEKYIEPIGNYLTLRDSWQTADFAEEFPQFIFEALCFHENDGYISGNSPYLREGGDWVFDFPAEIVEGMFRQYFDISAEELRGSGRGRYGGTVYIAEENVYRIEAFQGGGAYPYLEAGEVEENADGTISVGVVFVDALDGTKEEAAILTVQPAGYGEFRYISNESLLGDNGQ